MATFEFKSERNWTRVYDALYEAGHRMCSYGYKAITCFTEEAVAELRRICKKSRIAFTEI